MDAPASVDQKISVVIVEDEPIVALHIKHLLENFGYTVPATASNGREALEKIFHYQPDLVLMDVILKGELDGIETATRVRERRNAPIVYMTSYADVDTFQRAKATDPFGYILKPIDEQELYTTMELALLRQRKEKSLALAEDWYPLAGRIYMEGFWHWNVETDELFFSPRSESVLGVENEPPRSMDQFLALIHPEDRGHFREDLDQHIQGRSPFLDNIHRIMLGPANVRWIHSMAIATRNRDGRVQLVTGSLGDITGRKNTEQSLNESRRFIQGIMEAAPAIIYIYDLRDERPYYINRHIEEILGLAAEDVLDAGRQNFRSLLKFDKPVLREALHESRDPNLVLENEFRVQRSDGDWLWMSVREIVYTRSAEGQPEQILGTAYDITRRKQAELALIQEKEWQAVTLGSISDGVLTTDRQGRLISMNRVARKLTGVGPEQDVVGIPVTELCRFTDERSEGPLPDPVADALRSGETIEYYRSTRLAARDSFSPFISLTANPLHNENHEIIGAVMVLRDVTEQVRTERELRKMQSLDSLGILAGGIAHDFNNILTAIQNNVALARMEAGDEQAVRDRLGDAERACIRARGLTQQLLTFAKGGSPVKTTASITELISETADFVLRGSRVSPVYAYEDGVWPVYVDETQFSHVINNLVLNALQAMPEGGRIHIRCQNLEPGAGPARDALLKGDHYVLLTIQDEGSGIKREHLDHIFDPYFTTKDKGSGLGLASVYSIIRKHDGHVRVSSPPGEGACFSIYIPAKPGAVIERRSSEREPEHGEGNILLMDDEEDIRETLARILRRLGYRVEDAGDGESAVALYKRALESGAGFDLVILDLTVPGGMGGLKAAEAMQKLGGAARYVVSSGYSNDPVIADFRNYGFDAGIAKPFQIQDLSKLIKSLMDAPASTPKP